LTDRYAVIGNPVAHSKSPGIHAEFARATGQLLEYGRIEAPAGGFAAAVARFAAEGGRGLNVTVPFKLDAFNLAHERSARARAAGACNTLKRDGTHWYGDNTDGAGLLRDLTVNRGVAIAGKDVLVLGAGGAARGIMLPLADAGPRTLCISNRTDARALQLARELAPHAHIDVLSAGQVAQRAFDVVINATSAGLGSDLAAPWPTTLFRRDAFAYDLIYADAPTMFLQFAMAAGVTRTADGLGMLIEQAAESFVLWRGVRPQTATMIERMRPRRA
jgi:shikimate dehydrogenase